MGEALGLAEPKPLIWGAGRKTKPNWRSDWASIPQAALSSINEPSTGFELRPVRGLLARSEFGREG